VSRNKERDIMTRSLNEAKYNYFSGLGYLGALPDKEWTWRNTTGYGRGSLFSVYGDAGYSGAINERAYAYFNHLADSVVEGEAPVLDLDFVNQRYVNEGVYKPFSDLLTESGTTLDADGIHVGVGATLSLFPKPSEVELFSSFTTFGTGWSDNLDDTYSCDGSQAGSSLINTTSGTVVITRTVRITFTISGYASGSLVPLAGGSGAGTARSSNGTFTEDIVVVGNTVYYLQASTTFVGTVSNVSVQELVPFVGFDGSEGTWVFEGQWAHNGAATAYMLAGDANTAFIRQLAAATTSVGAFDGANPIAKSGVFTDNTNIKIAMSYKEGGPFNILADGGAEATASLANTLHTPKADIGHLDGASEAPDLIVKRILWYPTQFTELVRQEITS